MQGAHAVRKIKKNMEINQRYANDKANSLSRTFTYLYFNNAGGFCNALSDNVCASITNFGININIEVLPKTIYNLNIMYILQIL